MAVPKNKKYYVARMRKSESGTGSWERGIPETVIFKDRSLLISELEIHYDSIKRAVHNRNRIFFSANYTLVIDTEDMAYMIQSDSKQWERGLPFNVERIDSKDMAGWEKYMKWHYKFILVMFLITLVLDYLASLYKGHN